MSVTLVSGRNFSLNTQNVFIIMENVVAQNCHLAVAHGSLLLQRRSGTTDLIHLHL